MANLDKTQEIPKYFLDRKINHFSPSQGTMAVDQWVYKYLYCRQEDRRNFKRSSKMNSGVSVGEALEDYLIGKPVMSSPKIYQAYDDKDMEQYQQDKQAFTPTLQNAIEGLKELEVTKDEKNYFEHYVNSQPKWLEIPIIGRTDIHNDKIVVELKTKWRRRGGKKKDGTSSFSKINPPVTPDSNHLKQAAFYHSCTNLPTFLLYATEKGYSIFDIREYDYKKNLDEMLRSLVVKQRLAAQNQPLDWVDVDFTHYGWDIGDEYIKDARRLFSYGNYRFNE